MKYNVYVYEHSCINYEIDADSPDQALEKVLDGEGIEIDTENMGFVQDETYTVIDENNKYYEVVRNG